jgi:hypothetical protein
LGQLKKEGVLKFYNLSCVSRRNAAAAAVGKKKKHDEDQIEILK